MSFAGGFRVKGDQGNLHWDLEVHSGVQGGTGDTPSTSADPSAASFTTDSNIAHQHLLDTGRFSPFAGRLFAQADPGAPAATATDASGTAVVTAPPLTAKMVQEMTAADFTGHVIVIVGDASSADFKKAVEQASHKKDFSIAILDTKNDAQRTAFMFRHHPLEKYGILSPLANDTKPHAYVRAAGEPSFAERDPATLRLIPVTARLLSAADAERLAALPNVVKPLLVIVGEMSNPKVATAIIAYQTASAGRDVIFIIDTSKKMSARMALERLGFAVLAKDQPTGEKVVALRRTGTGPFVQVDEEFRKIVAPLAATSPDKLIHQLNRLKNKDLPVRSIVVVGDPTKPETQHLMDEVRVQYGAGDYEFYLIDTKKPETAKALEVLSIPKPDDAGPHLFASKVVDTALADQATEREEHTVKDLLAAAVKFDEEAKALDPEAKKREPDAQRLKAERAVLDKKIKDIETAERLEVEIATLDGEIKANPTSPDVLQKKMKKAEKEKQLSKIKLDKQLSLDSIKQLNAAKWNELVEVEKPKHEAEHLRSVTQSSRNKAGERRTLLNGNFFEMTVDVILPPPAAEKTPAPILEAEEAEEAAPSAPPPTSVDVAAAQAAIEAERAAAILAGSAKASVDARQLPTAWLLFQKAFDRDPKYAPAYRMAIEAFPNEPRPYLGLAHILLDEGDKPHARGFLKAFVERADGKPEFATDVAWAQKTLAGLEAELAPLGTTPSAPPPAEPTPPAPTAPSPPVNVKEHQEDDVATLLSQAERQVGFESGQSLSLYRRVLTLDPKNLDAFYGVANALDRLGKTAEALEAYRGYVKRENRAAKADQLALAQGRIVQLVAVVDEQGKITELIARFGAHQVDDTGFHYVDHTNVDAHFGVGEAEAFVIVGSPTYDDATKLRQRLAAETRDAGEKRRLLFIPHTEVHDESALLARFGIKQPPQHDTVGVYRVQPSGSQWRGSVYRPVGFVTVTDGAELDTTLEDTQSAALVVVGNTTDEAAWGFEETESLRRGLVRVLGTGRFSVPLVDQPGLVDVTALLSIDGTDATTLAANHMADALKSHALPVVFLRSGVGSKRKLVPLDITGLPGGVVAAIPAGRVDLTRRLTKVIIAAQKFSAHLKDGSEQKRALTAAIAGLSLAKEDLTRYRAARARYEATRLVVEGSETTDTSTARADYEKANAIDPGYLPAVTELATALVEEKKWDEVIALLVPAVAKEDGRYPLGQLYLGLAYQGNGDRKKALELLNAFLQSAKGHDDLKPRVQMAEAAVKQINDAEQAAALAEQQRVTAEKKKHDQAEAQAKVVQATRLFNAHRVADAKKLYDAARTLDPENLDALFGLASCDDQLGEYQTARDLYQEYVGKDTRPEHARDVKTTREKTLAALDDIIGWRAEIDKRVTQHGTKPDKDGFVYVNGTNFAAAFVADHSEAIVGIGNPLDDKAVILRGRLHAQAEDLPDADKRRYVWIPHTPWINLSEQVGQLGIRERSGLFRVTYDKGKWHASPYTPQGFVTIITGGDFNKLVMSEHRPVLIVVGNTEGAKLDADATHLLRQGLFAAREGKKLRVLGTDPVLIYADISATKNFMDHGFDELVAETNEFPQAYLFRGVGAGRKFIPLDVPSLPGGDQPALELARALDKAKAEEGAAADRLKPEFRAAVALLTAAQQDAKQFSSAMARYRALELVIRGEGAVADEKLDDALKLYDQALAADPSYLFATTHKADLLLKQKKYDDLVALLASTVAKHDDYADGKFYLGQAYVDKGEREKARNMLIAYVTQDGAKKAKESQVNTARRLIAALEAGLAEAKAHAEEKTRQEKIRADQKQAAGLVADGRRLFQAKRFAEAADRFKVARNLDDENWDALLGFAESLEAIGVEHYADALDMYRAYNHTIHNDDVTAKIARLEGVLAERKRVSELVTKHGTTPDQDGFVYLANSNAADFLASQSQELYVVVGDPWSEEAQALRHQLAVERTDLDVERKYVFVIDTASYRGSTSLATLRIAHQPDGQLVVSRSRLTAGGWISNRYTPVGFTDMTETNRPVLLVVGKKGPADGWDDEDTVMLRTGLVKAKFKNALTVHGVVPDLVYVDSEVAKRRGLMKEGTPLPQAYLSTGPATARQSVPIAITDLPGGKLSWPVQLERALAEARALSAQYEKRIIDKSELKPMVDAAIALLVAVQGNFEKAAAAMRRFAAVQQTISGVTLLRTMSYEIAKRFFDKAIATDSSYATPAWEKAWVLEQEKDWKTLADFADSYIIANPDPYGWYYYRGIAREQLGALEPALTDLKRFVDQGEGAAGVSSFALQQAKQLIKDLETELHKPASLEKRAAQAVKDDDDTRATSLFEEAALQKYPPAIRWLAKKIITKVEAHPELLAEVLPLLEERVKGDANEVDGRFYLAEIYRSQGKNRDAIPLYAEFLRQKGDATDEQTTLAHLGLANTLDQLGLRERARDEYKKFFDLETPASRKDAARSRRMAGALNRARAEEARLRRTINQRDALIKQARETKTIKFYDDAIKLDPNSDDTYRLLADDLVKAGQFALLAERLERYLAANPEADADRFFELAQAHAAQNKFSEARKSLTEVIKKNPTDQRASLALAKMCWLLGDVAAAQAALTHVTANAGEAEKEKLSDRLARGAFGYVDAGNEYSQNQQYDRARLLFTLALKLDSKNRDAVAGLARAYFATQEWQRAIDLLQPHVLADRTDVENWFNLGYAYEGLGMQTEARNFYIIATTNSDTTKNEWKAYYRLGFSYLNEGATAAAKGSFKAFLLMAKKGEAAWLDAWIDRATDALKKIAADEAAQKRKAELIAQRDETKQRLQDGWAAFTKLVRTDPLPSAQATLDKVQADIAAYKKVVADLTALGEASDPAQDLIAQYDAEVKALAARQAALVTAGSHLAELAGMKIEGKIERLPQAARKMDGKVQALRREYEAIVRWNSPTATVTAYDMIGQTYEVYAATYAQAFDHAPLPADLAERYKAATNDQDRAAMLGPYQRSLNPKRHQAIDPIVQGACAAYRLAVEKADEGHITSEAAAHARGQLEKVCKKP